MSGYDIGDTVADIRISDPEGRLQPLSAQIGERGLLVFVLRGTWCAICVEQMNTIQRNYHRFVGQGVTTVFQTPEAEGPVHTYKISQPTPLQYGLHPDPNLSALEQFIQRDSIGLLPAVYLLNRDLRVVWRHLGEHSEDRPSNTRLLEAIQNHLIDPARLRGDAAASNG
jgi:peroxiredoxin